MANNKIAYGLAKGHGIDTEGMTPKEVWAALDKKGVEVSDEADAGELTDFFDEKKKEPKVYEFFEKENSDSSGGIAGALNSNSDEANEHAKLYYDEIRKRTSDVPAIAKNTGMSEKDIENIKNHVFMEKHELDGGAKHFDPSYEMAQSWQRLCEGKNIQAHDITLLKHELEEQRIMREDGLDYVSAHKKADLKYNYKLEQEQYNARMKKEKEKK